jgi:hypothetical protein
MIGGTAGRMVWRQIWRRIRTVLGRRQTHRPRDESQDGQAQEHGAARSHRESPLERGQKSKASRVPKPLMQPLPLTLLLFTKFR